jgi:hypothetical protein
MELALDRQRDNERRRRMMVSERHSQKPEKEGGPNMEA